MTKRSFLLASVSGSFFGPARAYALKASVDSIDDLPDDLKDEYTQVGDKWVLQVDGMVPAADLQRVQGALTKERTEHGALKTRITTVFGDRKFEDIQATLDRVPELEAAADGKLDETKINEIVEGRVRTRLAPVERERDTLKTTVAEKDQTIQTFEQKERQRTIRDKATEAAVAAKVIPEAMDDFLRMAESVLEVREDDGRVVTKDQVGFTPGIEPSVLLTDLQAKKPHWWGPSTGGGGNGNRDGVRGGDNPFTFQNWNMTAQGQLIQNNPAKADQLAKLAGHTDAMTARKPAPPAVQ